MSDRPRHRRERVSHFKMKHRIQKRERAKQRNLALEELRSLYKRAIAAAPPRSAEISADPEVARQYRPPKLFSDLVVSKQTAEGLEKEHYRRLWPVQRLAIPHALAGRDVIIAAKAGSGKTLCFAIPLLEALYRSGFTPDAGLGAIVLAPARELCLQLFEVLTAIGAAHDFSCGLVIGGKDVNEEAMRVQRMNILIGTPSRVLYHLGRCAQLNTTETKMLIIDEADRCLEMGFVEEVREIITYLPERRQVMLASATLTNDLSTLIDDRSLALHDPEYINLTGNSVSLTPRGLSQCYIVVEPQDKLSALFSFLRMHRSAKILCFVATAHEARFIEAIMRRLETGLPIASISGRDKAAGRAERCTRFDELQRGVLFCTSVAERGLDYDDIGYVLLYDCPENVSAYVHRVGRTARAGKKGKAVLFLTPGEERSFAAQLLDARIPIKKAAIDPQKTFDVTQAVTAAVAASPELKAQAQRAVRSYVKSVDIADDSTVFSVQDINIPALAASYGIRAGVKVVDTAETEGSRAGDARRPRELDSDSDSGDIYSESSKEESG